MRPLWALLRKHWVQVLAWCVAVGLSTFFWLDAKKEREPMFSVVDNRTSILSKETVSDAPITVLRPDGSEVESDLTAVTLYFWNAGKESIKPANVLKPIKITLDDPEGSIMDFRVLNKPRDVTGFRIFRDSSNPSRVLSLDFAILEHHDGARIQVIYEGDPDADFAITGSIEGPSPIARYRPSRYRTGLFTVGLFAAFVVVGAVHLAVLGLAVDLCSRIWPNRKKLINTVTVVLLAVGFLSSLIMSAVLTGYAFAASVTYPQTLW